MKSKKPKFSKIKFSLLAVLWVLFLLAIVVEGLVLYKYLYLNLQGRTLVAPIDPTSLIHINVPAQKEAAAWLKAREDYTLPPYELGGVDKGRENPFAED